MATTRIISMHINKGKTVAQCLKDRTDYAKNPDKTQDGELVSSYACDPRTADAEFLFSKRQYAQLTGREQKNDVIAYQVRQSFKPGEVTPEEANRIGYEFASRFLKGKHAFIVATHTDKAHIHNHIIWNSTTLDCKHKFRDFLGSGRAVARLSDRICLEHKLSVIENPGRGRKSYDEWQGPDAKLSQRERLRLAIDEALRKRPESFDALLQLLREAGYTVDTSGKHITFLYPGSKKKIRLRSLGDGYSEEELRAVIGGTRHHSPRKRKAAPASQKASLLIDIQAKLEAGKGEGYRRWASVYNLKQMAATVLYLQENDIPDFATLTEKAETATARMNDLKEKIQAAEQRMSEVAALKTHIINYSKTRETFSAYRASGYSKRFYKAHEEEIETHRAAKRVFNELGLQKLPTVKSLQAEYAALLTGKKAAYAEYRAAKEEQRELLIHQANVARILDLDREAVEEQKRPERRADRDAL